jgi:hypothetical protein
MIQKGYLTTEILYAGGAVQQYIDTAPLSFTGWDGSDAAPPTYPFCPESNPVPEKQYPPGSGIERPDPPCIDIDGECLPIWYREDAGCGYRYVDVITGNIYEWDEEFSYQDVEAFAAKSFVKSWKISRGVRDPDTGESFSHNNFNAVVKSTITLVPLESRTDQYGNEAGEIKDLLDAYNLDDNSGFSDTHDPRDCYGEYYPTGDGVTGSWERYAGWEVVWGSSQKSHQTRIMQFKTNAIQLSGDALAGIGTVKQRIVPWTTWSMYGYCPQEDESPSMNTSMVGAGCGEDANGNSRSCLGKDHYYSVRNTDTRAYWVGILWDSLPYSYNWKTAPRYPAADTTFWSTGGKTQMYSWKLKNSGRTDSWYGKDDGGIWPCYTGCGQRFVNDPPCPDDNIWDDKVTVDGVEQYYRFNQEYWATKEWDMDYDPATGFSGWNETNYNLTDEAEDYIEGIYSDGIAIWMGTTPASVYISYDELCCQRKLSGSVDTRSLPSPESFNGQVAYTTDSAGKAHSWVWQDNEWHEFGQTPVYNGGEI